MIIKSSIVPATKNDIFEFNFSGNTIRAIKLDEKPWFVATEIASTLGYVNPYKAVIDHCKYAKILKPHESLGLTISPRGINVIPESDLFRLVMRSDLESAERFQDWVYEEVLPAIRQTGSYSAKQQYEIPQTLSEALRLAADLADQKARLEIENKVLTPKAESFDDFMAGENTQLIGVVAKSLGTGQNKLFQFLRDKKILIDSGEKYNTPYQNYIDAGYFVVVQKPVTRGSKKTNYPVTKVTPKGVDFICRLAKKDNAKTVISMIAEDIERRYA